MSAPDYCGHDLSLLFTIRVVLGGQSNAVLTVCAYDGNHVGPHGHARIDVSATLTENDPRCPMRKRVSRVIFARGDTYCGVPRGTTLDGIEAREMVLSLVAMKPGDTDDEYFEHYTPEQLAFAERWGEELSCERERRYCDPETGAVRR